MKIPLPLIILVITVAAVVVQMFVRPVSEAFRQTQAILGAIWICGSFLSVVGGKMAMNRSKPLGLVCVMAGGALFIFAFMMPFFVR